MCLMAQQTARVVKVWDGDTFSLLMNGKVVSVRLVNVDAPEKNQLWGVEAQRNCEQLLLGKQVLFEGAGKDKYKRVLGNIIVDGEKLDSITVRNGWAWHYELFSKNHELAKLQQMAIAEKAGLWVMGIEGVCPPWLFRKYDRVNKIKYCTGCKK